MGFFALIFEKNHFNPSENFFVLVPSAGYLCNIKVHVHFEKERKMRKKQKNMNEAIAKGYRLKPETHELVEQLSRKICGSKDEVISRACRMFNSSVERKIRNRNNNRH